MARTTVNLDDALIHAAKKHAIDEGTTLGKLIERGLRLALSTPPDSSPRATLTIRTYDGGAAPIVDVSNRDALYDAMDSGRTRA